MIAAAIALFAAVQAEPLGRFTTSTEPEEVALVEVDDRPAPDVSYPDVCSGADSQPTLAAPTLGESADGWPEFVSIEGTVTGILPSGCGFGCRPATLRIAVTEGPSEFRGRELHVFLSECMSPYDAAQYCGRAVRFRASKAYPRRLEHYLRVDADEFFDSQGVPYYFVEVLQPGVTKLA